MEIFKQHQQFHEKMINGVVEQLTEEEKVVLEKALKNLNRFFRDKARKV